MKTLKNLVLISGLAGLSFFNSGCKDNPKYRDFADFVMKNGKKNASNENRIISFPKNNKKYLILYSPAENGVGIYTCSKNYEEIFKDENLNGLNFYKFNYMTESEKITLVKENSPSDENKEKYERLIDSLPKWYAESKKKLRELSLLEEFNQDNKKVYETFAKFLKDNPNKKKRDENLYSLGEQIDFVIENDKIKFLEVKIDKTTFSDNGLNGLDDIFREKESGLIESESVKEMPPEKQLKLAQEYAKSLIKIMYKTKEKKNYKHESKEESKEKSKGRPTMLDVKLKEKHKKDTLTKKDIEEIEKKIYEEFNIKKGVQDEFNKQPK